MERIVSVCGCLTVGLLFASGCQGKPALVEIPPEAVQALASGLINVTQLNDDVLARISRDAGSDVELRQEWKLAPGMTSVSLPQAVVANLDNMIAPAGLPPLERDIAVCATRDEGTPIPTSADYLADSNPPTVEIRTADGGVLEDGGVFELLTLHSVKASVKRVSLVPRPATPEFDAMEDGTILQLPSDVSRRFDLSIEIEDFETKFNVGFLPGDSFVRANGVNITCAGRITRAPSQLIDTLVPQYADNSCGEVRVFCENPTIDVYGLHVSFLPVVVLPLESLIAEWVTEGILHDLLSQGVVLHFETLRATAFGFVVPGNGTESFLTLRGSSSWNGQRYMCSPQPRAVPQESMTPAVTQFEGHVGYGEFTSTLGYVLPFEVLPELRVEMDTSAPATGVDVLDGHVLRRYLRTQPLPDWTLVKREMERQPLAFGARLPPTDVRLPLDPLQSGGGTWAFEVSKFTGALRTRIKEGCWKQALDKELLLNVAFATNVIARSYAKELPDGRYESSLSYALLDQPLQLASIEHADYEEELVPAFKALGQEPPPNDREWSRVVLRRSVVDLPLEELLPARINPLEVTLWIDRQPQELAEQFGPSLRCELTPYVGEIESMRLYSRAGVVLGDAHLDLATLDWSHATDVTQTTDFVRTTVPTGSGGARTAVFATEGCVPRVSAVPGSECWRADLLTLGYLGRMSFTGYSNTTAPAGPLRTTPVSALGARSMLAHGVYDRSDVRVYSLVPQIYRDLGLVNSDAVFRGTATLDWEHVPGTNFSAPNGAGHLTGQQKREGWARVDGFPDGLTDVYRNTQAHYTNWRDYYLIRHEGTALPSSCALPEQLVAVPTTLLFSGGGLPQPKKVTTTQLALEPPDGRGHIVTSTTQQATLDTRRIWSIP